MKQLMFALVFIPMLFSFCTNKEAKPFREYSIHGELYETEIFASYPRILSLDSLLVIYAHETLGKLVTLYSPAENMKEIASFGTRGRGPGEYFALEINSTHGNHLFGRNMNMQELVVLEAVRDSGLVEVKEIERLKYERIFHDGVASEDSAISYLDEGHFVGVSYGEHGKFFSLYDDRMNWLAYFGDAPIPENLQPMNARQYLGARLASNDGAFVYSPTSLPKIVFYSYGNGVGVPQKEWEDTFYEPYYKVTNGLIGFDNSKTVGGVRNIVLGERYVYILFLDVPLGEINFDKMETSAPNIIFVYDRSGDRIARLNLDCRINYFCVSDDEKTIYGVTSIPEDRFVKFDIPKFR